jgi:hypothetical protein
MCKPLKVEPLAVQGFAIRIDGNCEGYIKAGVRLWFLTDLQPSPGWKTEQSVDIIIDVIRLELWRDLETGRNRVQSVNVYDLNDVRLNAAAAHLIGGDAQQLKWYGNN